MKHDEDIAKPSFATQVVSKSSVKRHRAMTVAGKAYIKAIPWPKKLLKRLFRIPLMSSKGKKGSKGHPTICAEAALAKLGYNEQEAELIVRETKGEVLYSFDEANIVETLGRGASYGKYVIKGDEHVVVLKDKLENYEAPALIRYKDIDWYPMSIRQGENGWEYYIKVAD